MQFILASGAALALFVLVLWWAATHNRCVHLGNLVRESWANVDVALKRRHDLIPNLLEVVKGYAEHERTVFDRVTQARERAMASAADLAGRAASESELGQAVHQLIARVEAYPELKASEQFLELQRELSNTEDRIAAARRFFNANVRELNTLIASFPASLVVGKTAPREYFTLDDDAERQAPRTSM